MTSVLEQNSEKKFISVAHFDCIIYIETELVIFKYTDTEICPVMATNRGVTIKVIRTEIRANGSQTHSARQSARHH